MIEKDNMHFETFKNNILFKHQRLIKSRPFWNLRQSPIVLITVQF